MTKIIKIAHFQIPGWGFTETGPLRQRFTPTLARNQRAALAKDWLHATQEVLIINRLQNILLGNDQSFYNTVVYSKEV